MADDEIYENFPPNYPDHYSDYYTHKVYTWPIMNDYFHTDVQIERHVL